jgi:5,6-dimethylbenzimidazole synthase
MGIGFSDAFREDFARLCRWRRDVRRFRAEPLAPGTLARLIGAAGTAPSVGLSEPWRFAIVESAAGRTALVANFEAENARALAGYEGERRALYAGLKLSGLCEAPGILAAFCDESHGEGGAKGRGLGCRTMPETRRYSVVCAVMQMWLAARAEGLGMGLVSILDPARAARDLGVPAGWHLVALLCLGYPEEEHDDPELERAGWEARDDPAARIITV